MLYQMENQHGGDVYGGGITLDFSANTNPLGTPPSVLEAVCRALPQLHRYSDPYCRRLVQAIATHEQVPASYILCGNGAADLIYTYCAALRPRTAVEPAPTFAEYGLGLAQVGCRVERYFLHQAQNFDLDERFLSFLEEKKPEAVFLCTPNNPTGRLLPLPLLEWILQGCAAWGARVFLDECFLDLTEDGVSAKALLAAHPELLILKAFTKSYGMAGIRLGYCLCADSALLHRMASASQPWNVSSLAQSAGVAALTEQDFLQRTRSLVHTERRWLTDNLTASKRAVPSAPPSSTRPFRSQRSFPPPATAQRISTSGRSSAVLCCSL